MIGLDIDPSRIALAIVIVGTLLLVVQYLVRRFRPGMAAVAGAGPILVAQCSLDMRQRIVVIRYGQTDHLILLGNAVPIVVAQQPAPGPLGMAEAGS
ncbi:MAG TPA: flagellar biosynthetic protein FliO [Geminicoccus sp.]|jgi:flagellar biogenesis protein FliO|uniref:flagellar biosynthetic protein FliO n=1 Tax=Geminicoccus sp. TaxID=2024832 RepID=UPI002E36204E|nr:flagellar biosynthetic protein FliO [Geminicoccus sp.]HEX2525610.1 flagellar biosynthetic protein FliO [Geminicoccus sp.]